MLIQKIVSISAILYPRRPPLLKIEISSNGQNCSILSQKVPKFELYKHNDELFTGHNFGREPSKDHSTKVWLQLAQWFLRRRFLCEFPKGSYVKLSSAMGAILIEGPNRLTHFWSDPLYKLCPSEPPCIQDGRH
jgi:hypothetical protein